MKPPTHPEPEAIDPEKLDDAAAVALRNAIASLAARQAAEGNDTDLIFPPFNRRTVVDHEEFTRRYSRKTVTRTRPKYKRVYGYRMAPQKDQYGNITGYKKQRYVKERIKIGETQYTREVLVRDPKGKIKRTHRRRIYGPGGPDYVPRGLIGLNSMALYVLAKAGLDDHYVTTDLADELAERLDTYGLPDHTFDLAWATAAFAAYPSSEHEQLNRRLAGKLIDGQIREGRTQGGWGPVAIHYELLGQYMLTEIKLYNEIEPIRRKLEELDAKQDEGSLNRREARMEAILEKKLGEYRAVLDAVNKGLTDVSLLGPRFNQIDREYRPDDDWGKAGLPYYIYNRILGDAEATALAAFALAEVADAGRLPDRTPRHEVDGKPLAPPENTRTALMTALRHMARAQQRNGGWDEGNTAVANNAFNRFRTLGLQDVPFRGDLPDLPSLETVRTNLDGYAAMTGLLNAWGDRAPAAFARSRERAFDHVHAALEAFVDKPIDLPEEALAYAGQTDTKDELTGRRGQLSTEIEPVSDPAELPVSFLDNGADMMRSAAVFLDNTEGLSTEQSQQLDLLRRRLAYRLLIRQGTDGQWEGRSSGLAATSSLRQYIVWDKAQRLREWYEKHPDRDRTPNFWANDRRLNILSRLGNRDYRAPNHLYPTLAACLVLVDVTDAPIDLDERLILPAEPEAGAVGEGEAADAEEEADAAQEPAEPMDPDEAASSVQRFNEALLPLVEAIGQFSESTEAEPGDTEPGESGDAPPADAP